MGRDRRAGESKALNDLEVLITHRDVEGIRELLSKNNVYDVSPIKAHLLTKQAASLAVREKNYDVLVELLQWGAKGTALVKATPVLIRAIQAHRADVVGALLEAGADPDVQVGCRTAISVAAAEGQVDIVRLLLDKGADVLKPFRKGRHPLHLAVQRQQYDLVERLLQLGADPACTFRGVTIFELARFDAKMQEILRAHGAYDCQVHRPGGVTEDRYITGEGEVVLEACDDPVKFKEQARKKKKYKILRPSQSVYGVDSINASVPPVDLVEDTEEDHTSSHSEQIKRAIVANDVGAVEGMLTDPSEPVETFLSDTRKLGKLFDLAMRVGKELLDYSVAKLLLRHGRVLPCDLRRRPLIYSIIDSDDVDFLSIAIEKGVCLTPGYCITPLRSASSLGNIAMVRLLVDHGVSVVAPSKYGKGKSPLALAVEFKDYQLAETLVRKGAAVDERYHRLSVLERAKNDDKMRRILLSTPDEKHQVFLELEQAIKANDKDRAIRMLQKCNILTPPSALSGRIAAVAVVEGKKRQDYAFIKLFLDWGLDGQTRVDHRKVRTLVHLGIQVGDVELVRKAIAAGCCVDQVYRSKPPLFLRGPGSTEVHMQMLELLLDAGADVRKAERQRPAALHTPLSRACNARHYALVSKLVREGADVERLFRQRGLSGKAKRDQKLRAILGRTPRDCSATTRKEERTKRRNQGEVEMEEEDVDDENDGDDTIDDEADEEDDDDDDDDNDHDDDDDDDVSSPWPSSDLSPPLRKRSLKRCRRQATSAEGEPNSLTVVIRAPDILHAAISTGDTAFVNDLISAGADVNTRATNTSHIYHAASCGHFEIVKLLIRRGGVPDPTEAPSGEKSLQDLVAVHCESTGNWDLLPLILEKRTKRNEREHAQSSSLTREKRTQLNDESEGGESTESEDSEDVYMSLGTKHRQGYYQLRGSVPVHPVR